MTTTTLSQKLTITLTPSVESSTQAGATADGISVVSPRRRGMVRRVGAVGMAVVALAALAACGHSDTSTSTSASSTRVSSTTATEAMASADVSTIEPTTSSMTTTSGDVPKCTAEDLSLSMGSPNGAAGSVYYDLILTNSSDHPCTMYGYPGVSAVTAEHTQVGPAAERNGEAEGSIFELAPGASATAALELVQAGAYSPEKCGPASAAGFLVYPPDDTGSLYVDLPTVICTNQANTIVIGPMHKQ